ncbi:MAG TPA: nickel-dependent lactate racemase [Anaerolineaceae bacterium]
MTTYSLPYGKTHLTFEIPSNLDADLIIPNKVSACPDGLEEVKRALIQPVGSAVLSLNHVHSVVITVNDKTRPVPNHLILPPLLDLLSQAGIPDEHITLMIATGTHQPMRKDEFSQVLPQDIVDRYPIISHNCDNENNLKYLGITSSGTPVWVNRQFHAADLKIVTGSIEPHHFQGYSGGAKSASVGVCGRKTINHNHAMMLDGNARMGVYDSNPTRQDVEEIGDILGIHFALNVVMNTEKDIVEAFFGTPREVMKAGIPVAQKVYETPINGKYDLVIASAGGHPKDINLYQAQKGLTHASLLTRDGGVVILTAACPEGSGSESFEAFMEGLKSYQDVFDKFKNDGFKVGPHKAFQIARDANRVKVILLSDIPDPLVEKFLLFPAHDPQMALMHALDSLPPQPRIAIMPKATSTIPATI